MTAITYAFTPEFLIVGLVALGVTIFTLVDVVRHPEWAWQGSHHSRTLWLVLTIVALFFGLVGLVVDLVYVLAIRPGVVAAEKGGPGLGAGYGGPYGSSTYGTPTYGGYGQPGGSYGPPGAGYGPPGGGYGTPGPGPGYGSPGTYPTPPSTPGAYPTPPPTTPGAYPTPPPPSTPASYPAMPPPPSTPASPPPGWYPDPAGSGQPRYWDGQSWT